MPLFVGVRNMPAIPGQQKVDAVKGCQSQVKGIAHGRLRHRSPRLVHSCNFHNLLVHFQGRQSLNQSQAVRLVRVIARRQLIKNYGGYKAIISPSLRVPPFPRPRDVSSQGWTIIAVIGRDRGFDVHKRLHGIILTGMGLEFKETNSPGLTLRGKRNGEVSDDSGDAARRAAYLRVAAKPRSACLPGPTRCCTLSAPETKNPRQRLAAATTGCPVSGTPGRYRGPSKM